jgi:hypothetical protein
MHLAFGLGAGHLDLGLLHTDERRLSLVLKLIWRLASIVASRSLSVRLRARRCATFARASVTASSKPLIRFAENARLLGEVLVDALGRERGFFINPHSIVPVSNRAALPNVGSDELSTAVCRRLLDTCWTPKEFNQPSL